MEILNVKEIVANLQERLNNVSEELKREEEVVCLNRCNWVAEVGAYTISTNDKGEPKLIITDFPMCFSDKGKEEIKKMTFSHGDGSKAEVKFYKYREYLRKNKQELEETIELYKKYELA